MMKLAICTKNGTHGGVEALIGLHQRELDADVFVCGGVDQPELTPFEYVYVEKPATLLDLLRAGQYGVVEYHWLFAPFVEAVRDSGLPCVEVVHRTDTAECDKSVPHVLVAHSEFLAHYVDDQCGREVAVIPNAIDVESFPDVTAQSPHETLVIGGITKYDPSKGMDLLLRAWGMIQHEVAPNTRIQLYGEGDWAEYLRRMSAVLGLRDVTIGPPIKGPEHYLGEFDLIVHPSRMEGMPIAIQEALACNLPVIATALDGMVEFNERSKAEVPGGVMTLVPPDDVSALADAIKSCVMGRSATREYIRKHYGKTQHLVRMRDAYYRAIEIAGQQQSRAVAQRGHRAFVRQPRFMIGGAQPTMIVLGMTLAMLRDSALLAFFAHSGWNVVALDYTLEKPFVQVGPNLLVSRVIDSDMVTRPLAIYVADPACAAMTVMLNPQAVIYQPAVDERDATQHEYLWQYADLAWPSPADMGDEFALYFEDAHQQLLKICAA